MTVKIYEKMAEAGGRLRVRSALNPALWLCAIVVAPALLLVWRLGGTPSTWLLVLVFAPVITAIVGFLFLLFFDRDKLQSEEYQLRKRSLELIQEKGDPFPVLGASIQAITNPRISRQGSGSQGDGQ